MLIENINNYSERNALFPGNSCYPLSPNNAEENKKNLVIDNV